MAGQVEMSNMYNLNGPKHVRFQLFLLVRYLLYRIVLWCTNKTFTETILYKEKLLGA